MTRRAMYSGSWYPAEAYKLDEYVQTDGEGRLKGAVLPHSGLYYSGELISDFFTSITASTERVIILSPSHYYYLEPDTFYTASFTSSATPYGVVRTGPLDLGPRYDRAVEREHGIEMFLPFIAKKELSVSYALLSAVSSEEKAEELSQSLLPLLDEETVLIASSDFTHYGPGFNYMPFGRREAKERTEAYDGRAAALLSQGDVHTLFKDYNGKSTICGLAPAMVASLALRSLNGRTGRHYTSLDRGSDGPDFVDYYTVLWSKE